MLHRINDISWLNTVIPDFNEYMLSLFLSMLVPSRNMKYTQKCVHEYATENAAATNLLLL